MRPHPASNCTSFDYSYCNDFEVRFGTPQEGATILTVWLSFVAPAASMHWTRYEPGMKAGEVVAETGNAEAERVAAAIARWIEEIGFELVSAATYGARVVGVELELSDPSEVTVGKCLFRDFDG